MKRIDFMYLQKTEESTYLCVNAEYQDDNLVAQEISEVREIVFSPNGSAASNLIGQALEALEAIGVVFIINVLD